MNSKIRWGILGLGNIAHNFVQDLLIVEDAELTAVASRSIDKAKSFSKQYGSKYGFGSYQELFECKDVDAVYIATPHTHHAELSIQAMDHGKHVLCEKPMGTNGNEVKKMIVSAKKNKVFLMEALWSRFNPTIQSVKQMVNTGTIGEIKYIHADFAFYALDRDEKGRILNPDLAGGTLLDIGIYPIFLAYLLLGKPRHVQASSKFYATGVEIQTAMIFEYESAHAVLYSGLNSKSEMKAEISATNGTIHIHPRWHEAQGFSIEMNDSIKVIDKPTMGKGYYHEIQEVHSCLRNNMLESKIWSHQNSIDLIDLLDKVRGLTGVKFPFEK
ncbi:Gfo/Idh/MocA family protein [Costertonia aggregata]|uniref:Gfo/Idh/MocA family oxidoreductase n=1 Tax=Costertonia aggregata TaxID=343403 RepID=A0A7H9AUR8_9FLAO|nr:Gfo/Idh/MocA family oxidoreductase [Costertonia aggregata]QLG47147.1 Gfo/Idh/MocA family oxidoreductase [Costertonia aggregata]